MKVYLIRHANSVDDLQGLHQNDDTPLVSEKIDILPFKALNPEKIYSSNILRAKQTAELLFGDYEVLDYIHGYIRPKFLDGVTREVGDKFWKKHFPELRQNHDWTYDGCESFNDIKERTKKLYYFLNEHACNDIAIVSHRSFLRHFIAYCALGDNYSFANYQDLMFFVKWDNLEMKVVEL